MGYAKHDVQEALARDEPSAIKDAYLIVRENQIMKANRKWTSLAQAPLRGAYGPRSCVSRLRAWFKMHTV